MITLRKAHERFRTRTDWLGSWHSFSFGEHYDPAHRGFSDLRVINDDVVAPGKGFATHGHRDMEIITYVLSGALSHKDSLGTGSTILPGDVQRMSAGRGIQHSEFNASDANPVHLLQIWIQPSEKGIGPSYAQKEFPVVEKQNRFRLVVSPDGADGSLTMHQDAFMYAAMLEGEAPVAFTPRPGRKVWVQVARGITTLNGQTLEEGDGAAVENETQLAFTGSRAAEVLLFDLR